MSKWVQKLPKFLKRLKVKEYETQKFDICPSHFTLCCFERRHLEIQGREGRHGLGGVRGLVGLESEEMPHAAALYNTAHPNQPSRLQYNTIFGSGRHLDSLRQRQCDLSFGGCRRLLTRHPLDAQVHRRPPRCLHTKYPGTQIMEMHRELTAGRHQTRCSKLQLHRSQHRPNV